MRIIKSIREQPLHILLIFLPISVLAKAWQWEDIWLFGLSAIAIIPLASLIGESTESLAIYTGPRLGGLLNATLGNAAELIITIFAIRAGLLELVKASITGSILGNLLLVMGMSMLLGGLRNGLQSFNSRHASRNAILLVLSVMALLIPSVVSHSIDAKDITRNETLSLGIATIMIILYIAGLLFSYRMKEDAPVKLSDHEESNRTEKISAPRAPSVGNHKTWSLKIALIVLVVSTVAVAYLSELLVSTVEPVIKSLGVSEFFLGVILIPIIGNVAEHLVAVKVAIKNQMDLSVEIAVASSLQIALFVAPVLVFLSLIIGNPLQLIFNEFELLALVVAVLITALVCQDGESNWLEGAELLALYFILTLAFFLIPF